MLQSEYWISELAGLSGVSTRTIRYYIQEGLLPQPEIRGKYAVFTDEYMHRLHLIRRLKDAYLPLNRIRDLLDALDDNRIVPLLEKFESDPVAALSDLQALPVFNQPAPESLELNSPAKDSALHYIQNLRSPRRTVEEAPKPLFINKMNASVTPHTSEDWQRISLAPGVELHVRQPVRPRLQHLIDQVIELFKQHNPNKRED
jgi:DNA-binding transcriptional MerR regulator